MDGYVSGLVFVPKVLCKMDTPKGVVFVIRAPCEMNRENPQILGDVVFAEWGGEADFYRVVGVERFVEGDEIPQGEGVGLVMEPLC